MNPELEQLRTEVLAAIAAAADETAVEQARIKYRGQSAALIAPSKGMKDASKVDSRAGGTRAHEPISRPER